MAKHGDLLKHAVEAGKHLEALATGLAGEGVDPQVVKTVTKCAEVTRQVVKVLGKPEGQALNSDAPEDQARADEEPAAEPAPEAEGAAPPRDTYDSAASSLVDDVKKRKAARAAA